MDPFRESLSTFNDFGVRYVIVGGLAVVLHGYPRLTVDLDVVIALDEDNALRAINALELIGFVPRVPVNAVEFANRESRQRWIDEKGMKVFTMINPRRSFFAVDLFVDPPISFDQLVADAKMVNLDGLEVTVCSVEHLRRMKVSAGRDQDLMDLEALKEVTSE